MAQLMRSELADQAFEVSDRTRTVRAEYVTEDVSKFSGAMRLRSETFVVTDEKQLTKSPDIGTMQDSSSAFSSLPLKLRKRVLERIRKNASKK